MRGAFWAVALPALLTSALAASWQSPNRPPMPPVTTDPEPGIARTLAEARAGQMADLRYTLAFSVPAERGEAVTGRATITFALRSAAAPVVLDFAPDAAGALHRVDVNGSRRDVVARNGHLVVPASALRIGTNEVVVVFTAGNASLNRNDDFLYTIFVPARAHEAFPCVDQPDLKGRWTLHLDVPEGWEALANGAEIARTAGNGRTHLTFAETAPLPTYLFAFAAGRFTVERGERDGRVFRMLHRETDAAKVARNRDALFDLHAGALRWLEDYTGVPYPFGKLDALLVPAFQFGGMEHPGAVFYNAPAMLLDESATQNQRLERASTIAHETAHMWFGDLVTMRWFSDVWMKEVFANFMAAKIVNPAFPDVNHELRFLFAHYPAAYDVDRTGGTNAIRQPLDNLKDAGTLYGAIIYQKAPIVMRHLERMLGADVLRDGLREYLATYRFGNAAWSDLIAILDARTADDLAAWSRAWVEERGRPIVRTALAIENDRIASLSFTVRDPYPMRGLTWTQDVHVALGYPDRVEQVSFRLGDSASALTQAHGKPAPLFVLPNGSGLAYGEFHLDRRSLAWLTNHLPEVADPLTRGSAWVTLWDALLGGEVRAPQMLELLLRALPQERDELNTQRILGYLQQTWWKFTSDGERERLAPRVEQVLAGGLARAETTSLASAYFATLRDVALTPGTVARLTRVWRGEESVRGLTLAEPDFIALTEALAVRGTAGSPEVLQQQIDRIANPDRRLRLQFIAPAFSADPAERDRFFHSLADVANRRREPWVLDGLRALHHPLRASASMRYIRPSLDLLAEIQQTGDIFFPKRWMDATLAGHRSPEAARIVRAFLDQAPPSYPERLRRIILSSADDLFRASSRP
jgi:aminopeptidase N